MNQKVIDNCELFIRNREILHDTFKWDFKTMATAGSTYFVGQGTEIDLEKLKACEKLLKEKTGMMSAYRGNAKLPLICKMASADDPAKFFDDIDAIVNQLKVLKHHGTEFKVLAAITVYENSEPEQVPAIIEKIVAIYKGMKDNHPLITSSEDIPFAAILAVSDIDEKEALETAEKCYEVLTKNFRSKNAVQSLSHILAIDAAKASDNCNRVVNMFNMLQEKNHKFGKDSELAVLGTMTALDIPDEEIVNEIIEADDFLKGHKGFGSLTMGDKTRRMFAAMMVADAHLPKGNHTGDALMDSIMTIVFTMEMCLLITIVTTSTIVATN